LIRRRRRRNNAENASASTAVDEGVISVHSVATESPAASNSTQDEGTELTSLANVQSVYDMLQARQGSV